MIAVYQNTIVPIPRWVNIINALPFFLTVALLAYLFIFLEHGYFWKIFISVVFLVTYVSLVMNFGFIFPRYYNTYQFSCDLNNINEPLINLELDNFGRGVSIIYIFVNLSDSKYTIFSGDNNIDGNMKYTLKPNENIKTSFNIKLPKNANQTIKVTNNIDCGEFNCYILGKTPTYKECIYKCESNKCSLIQKTLPTSV